MPNYTHVRRLLAKVQVVRAPRHRLATFGETKIHYTLITDVIGMADRARVRTGFVTAERPALLTPETLRDKFAGFGTKARDLSEWLVNQYGDALRGLEYQFHNRAASTKIELQKPDALVARLLSEYDADDGIRKALLRGTDKLWELALMKFIVEETLSSFSSNVRELAEHGFFEGPDREANRREREIKSLFARARRNGALVPDLGRKLKEYGLFERYQDEFFSLIR